MGKSNRKRPSTTEDQCKNKHKQACNEEEEEDDVSDEENSHAGKGGQNSQKRETKGRDNMKKKQRGGSRDKFDQSNKSTAESESESEDEVLSKIAKQLKDSSSKDREEDESKNKHKKARNEEEEEDDMSDDENGHAGNGEKKIEQQKTKGRDSRKKKQRRASRDDSDQADKSAAESEDEVLSKTAEQLNGSSSKEKEEKKKKHSSREVEVEKIIAHKQVKNQREYLVKWKDSSKGETWEYPWMVAKKCLDLLRAYNANHEIRDNVEAIVSHRKDKGNQVHYLIKWKSNSIGEIWEPAGKMKKICPDLIKTYKAEILKQNVAESIIAHRQGRSIMVYKIKWKGNNKRPTWVHSSKLALLCADASSLLERYRANRKTQNQVESIISHKKVKHFFRKYLIKWKDHSRDESWESHRLIKKICPKMLRDYTDMLEKKKTNQIKAVVEHKIDHGKSYYLIKWNDKSRVESWETAKTTMSVGPDMFNIFLKMNPDCYPRIPKDSSKAKKKSQKNKTHESDDEESDESEESDENDESDENKESDESDKSDESGEWDENEEWEVERILDVSYKKDKSREFLVHWKDYASKYDSWEPEEGLNCTDLIANFMEAKDNSRSSSRHVGKTRPVYIDNEE